MSTSEPSHPSSSLVDFVPLMRSPATWIPKPVALPPDIHPLPEDISAYFVYPYALEDFVLHPQPPHQSHAERIRKLHEEHEVRVKFLKERHDEKTRQRRDALRKVAPGYEPPEDDEEEGSLTEQVTHHRHSGILEPTRKPVVSSTSTLKPLEVDSQLSEPHKAESKPRDVMDDLVEGLARMDELEGQSGSIASRQ